MYHKKFLLFSAVCCYVLQAVSCDGPSTSQQQPIGTTFRPFVPARLPSGSVTSNELPASLPMQARFPTFKFRNSMEPGKLSSTVKLEEPSSTPEQPAQPATPEVPQPSPKKKLGRSASKNNSKSEDPLNIANSDELIERAKQLIRNLIKNDNANRAVTLLVLNGRDILENKIASDIIRTHTHLIKQTLSNEHARDIIKDISFDILETATNPETPKKIETALSKSLKCLSSEELPNTTYARFRFLRKMIKNKKTYPTAVSFKNAFVKFISSPDYASKIIKAFKLIDLAIQFDPNNLLKSITGFSLFK